MLKVDMLKPSLPYGANTYVVTYGGECAVVDPATPYSEELVSSKPRYILLTHGHFDHILDVKSWVDATGAEVIVSSKDALMLSDPKLNCFSLFFGIEEGYFGDVRTVSEGETLPLGDSHFLVMECPGHTSGSLCYLIDGIAFVGDTVFAGGGFGRWDLPTGDRATLCSSISRIVSLDDSIKLYCGHGDPTTVAEYKAETKLQRII